MACEAVPLTNGYFTDILPLFVHCSNYFYTGCSRISWLYPVLPGLPEALAVLCGGDGEPGTLHLYRVVLRPVPEGDVMRAHNCSNQSREKRDQYIYITKERERKKK